MKPEETIAYWTMILAFATIILALSTAFLVLVAYRELSKNERNSRFNVYRDIFVMLADTQKARVLINKLIRENNKAHFDYGDMTKNPKEINELHKAIISDWDKIALMLEDKVVPESFIMEYYSRGIIFSWQYFSAYIHNERAIRKHEGYKKKFEELHDKAYAYRKRNKHDGELVNHTDR